MASSVVEPAQVEREGLFTACANCNLLGAEICLALPSERYVCSEFCATSVRNNGIPKAAVPIARSVTSSMKGIVYKCSLLDPKHLVDAAQWLVVSGTEQIEPRLSGLHVGMVHYNITRGGPYSHLPLPLDPDLYNRTMVYARHYAQNAISSLPADGTNISTKEVLEKLRQQRADTGETDAPLHAMTLWYVYATFWRRYLHTYDWASFCDLSEADRAKTTQMRPREYPPPDPASPAMVSQDTRASMLRLRLAIEQAVQLLFDTGLTRELIAKALVSGLFADVKTGEFDIRSPEPAVVGGGTPDRVLSVEGVDALVRHSDVNDEELFVRAVTEAHAGITSWVKARFNRALGRVKGFTSRVGYDWVSLADRLYQVALANKCNGGMMAKAAGLAIDALYKGTGPNNRRETITHEMSFVVKYRAALRKHGEGLDLTGWEREFDTYAGAALVLARQRKARDERIEQYTCVKSSSSKLSISVWVTLPDDIARQIIAMVRYIRLDDRASGVPLEKRKERVKKDIVSLVTELVRKVGTDDATDLLIAISPVADLDRA